MNEKQLILYARLCLLRGVNLKKKQPLVINAPITAQDFVRALTYEAYHTFKSGRVEVNWQDPVLARVAYKEAEEATLTQFPKHPKIRLKEQIDQNSAFLTIASPTPGLLHGIDQKKVQRVQQAKRMQQRDEQSAIMKTRRFANVPYPSQQWAKRVFPDLEDTDALLKLHEYFISVMGLDEENPIKSLTEHLNQLEKRRQTLNHHQFDKLELTSNTVNLTVSLPEQHLWISGVQKRDDALFIPNLPLVELFTSPTKTGVNGTIDVTRPTPFQNQVIKPFKLTVRYGEVVNVEGEGKAVVEKLLAIDDGAKYIGEIGLVPSDAVLYQLNTLFFYQPFDENSASHVALGNAYPMAVKSQEKNIDRLMETHQLNRSRLHLDIPIGTDDLTITGLKDGQDSVEIFKDGTYAPNFTT